MSAIFSRFQFNIVLMIYHKVYITEFKLRKHPEKNYAKLDAMSRLKKLLNQVNKREDITSISTSMDLENLLSRKKGEKLDDIERNLVVEIFTNEN